MDVNRTVAGNLKAQRERRRLSLDQLAQLSGVSKSMLGQIERGEVNPTISVLWKIAGGLKVSFSSLIERESLSVEVVRKGDVTALYSDDGLYLNLPVFPFEEGRKFEQYRIEVQPHGRLDAQAHLMGTEEYVMVFTGELVVTADGVRAHLQPGDAIRFLADVPHSYENPGDVRSDLSMTLYYP